MRLSSVPYVLCSFSDMQADRQFSVCMCSGHFVWLCCSTYLCCRLEERWDILQGRGDGLSPVLLGHGFIPDFSSMRFFFFLSWLWSVKRNRDVLKVKFLLNHW